MTGLWLFGEKGEVHATYVHSRQSTDFSEVPARCCEADRFRGCSWNVQCSVVLLVF